MDAMQFLRGVENPMQPHAQQLGLVPDYEQRLQAIYPGQSIAQLEQNVYNANRAEFDRLLAIGRPDVLQGWITSRLRGTMYEDMEELAFAVGRSVNELQYYLSADPLELLRQAEAQQEAARLAEIAANAERIRLQQIEEQRAADARVRQWELEARQMAAESAARQAAQTAQRIAQAEAQLRDELRARWPAGNIDAQVTIYNQLLTQPPRSHAEVESILRDVLGEGAELQTLLRYTRNAQQGISLAETAAQIAREEAEAPIRAFQAATQAELQKTLQDIAESGTVPVEEMIATGAYTQAQIDLAAQVQARQLAAQQEATRLDLARQQAEQRAIVVAEIADIIGPQIVAVANQSDNEKANFYNTLISQGFDDTTIRDVVEVTLGEQADSDWQALQSIAESSRKIVAPEVVTAPPAPSDQAEQRAIVVAEIADIIGPQIVAVASQSDNEKANFYNTLISQGFDDTTIRDVVEVTLGEQADSDWQALQSIAESSRKIVAPEVVTVPPAPSDQTVPVVPQIFYEVPETTPPVEPEIIDEIPFPDVSIREVPETTPPVKTPTEEQYVFGDITLPQGWYQFTPAQKATWFNQNKVTPARLRAAGVPDQDIIYLRQAGYTIQDATTTPPVTPVAPAAGNLLPLALAAAFVLFGG